MSDNKERYTSAEVGLIVETLNSHFTRITDFVESVTKSITQMSLNQMAQCKLLEELKTQYTISEKIFLETAKISRYALDPEKSESVTSIIRGMKLSLRIGIGIFAFLFALTGILMATGLIKITFIIPGGES